MSKETYDRLRELVDKEIEFERIDYVDGRGRVSTKTASKDQKLAELIGILLGDGHIHSLQDNKSSGNYIAVTLNEIEDELFNKTLNLFREFFGEAYTYNSKIAHSKQIRSYGAENLRFLKENGLESGNKVENQVNIPRWIFEKREYIIAALRGLIDTDGSIYTRSHDTYVVIQFRNRSYPLLEDFEELCKSIGIRCSSGGEYDVQVASQDEVIKFLDIVKPIKESRIKRPIKA